MVAFAIATFVLDFAELIEGAIELASEALAVDADLSERARLLAEGEGHGKCGFGVRMPVLDAVCHFGDAEREEIGFDSGGAVHAPRSVNRRLEETRFGGAFGLVFVEESL